MSPGFAISCVVLLQHDWSIGIVIQNLLKAIEDGKLFGSDSFSVSNSLITHGQKRHIVHGRLTILHQKHWKSYDRRITFSLGKTNCFSILIDFRLLRWHSMQIESSNNSAWNRANPYVNILYEQLLLDQKSAGSWSRFDDLFFPTSKSISTCLGSS